MNVSWIIHCEDKVGSLKSGAYKPATPFEKLFSATMSVKGVSWV